MAKEFPRLAPMERIMRTAAAQQAGPLKECHWRSFPIPARGFDTLYIQFLYSAAKIDTEQGPLWIGAPSYLVSINAETAKTVELRPFDPREIGVSCGPWLGQDHPTERRAQMDFVEQGMALMAEYDVVLPALAVGTRPVPEPAALAAGRLAARFRFLAEAPLLPFYQRLGGWFFGWVGEVKK